MKADPINHKILEQFRQVMRDSKVDISDYYAVRKYAMHDLSLNGNKSPNKNLGRLAGWLSWAGEENFHLLHEAERNFENYRQELNALELPEYLELHMQKVIETSEDIIAASYESLPPRAPKTYYVDEGKLRKKIKPYPSK